MTTTIRNPIEWGLDQIRLAGLAVGSVGQAIGETGEDVRSPPLTIRRIAIADLGDALARGLDDFRVFRTDVIFLCVVYPVLGLVLGRLAFGYGMVPLLFPLASGFALVGPFAALGLYEMSRRRELGTHTAWPDAFGVVGSPAFGKIAVLGLLLVVIFLLWLAVAQAIYFATFGLKPPASLAAFLGEVFTTGAGWSLIALGIGIGFLFAVLVLAIGTVSFPLLIDRDVTLGRAVWTSVSAFVANPVPLALWGLIVAGGLVLGSLPLFLGLIVVMPVLGHATWHLYRKLVAG
ncbi:MAG TPA: DUF2189 domain-containing protein [Stellaceae bacterium]|nr:DUF2189 domain-containing protein [Stellaceae bacterium]